MKNKMIAVLATGLLMLGISGIANATIWDWSFAGESGQFLTDGDGDAPGTYKLIDFSVTSSAVGGTIGSLSGGQYTDGIWDTALSFSFVYDGLTVTTWKHAGGSTEDIWAFKSTSTPGAYRFGQGQSADGHMIWIDADCWCGETKTGGPLTVSATAPVPEPSTWVLLSAGIVTFIGVRRKRI